MGRLTVRLLFLFLVFSAAMAMFGLAVYATWWYALVGAGLMMVFAGLGALMVPTAQSRLPEHRAKPGGALFQAFGALCTLELLVLGLVTWCYGNRSLSDNNAYQALGLIIFLGLLGVGIQGAVAALIRFAYFYNQSDKELRAARGGLALGSSH